MLDLKLVSKMQVRLLLAAKEVEAFTPESLQRDIAKQFKKRYRTVEIQPEFQQLVDCAFFVPDIRRSVLYHKLSGSGKRYARKLAAIAANPESEHHELTQMSMSPNIRQQQQA